MRKTKVFIPSARGPVTHGDVQRAGLRQVFDNLELLGAAEEVRGDDPREGEAATGAVGGSLARGALVLPAALGHLVLVGDLVHEAGLRGPGTLQSEGDGDG